MKRLGLILMGLMISSPAYAFDFDSGIDAGGSLSDGITLDPDWQLPDFEWAFEKADGFGDDEWGAGYALDASIAHWSGGQDDLSGDRLRATASFDAWARINGVEHTILAVSGRAYGEKNNDEATLFEASVYLVGAEIFNDSWDGTFESHKTWSATFFTVKGNFTVAGIPVTASLSAGGSFGYDLTGTVNPSGRVSINFTPRGEAHATGKAGVGIGDLSAGVYSTLTLIEAHVPVTASASLSTRMTPRLYYNLDVDLVLSTLDGEIGLYAGSYTLPLFDWEGFETTYDLYAVNGSVGL